MRILIATYALRGGGIETFVITLANALCAEHDVEVCTIHSPAPDDLRRRLDRRVRTSTARKSRSYNVPRAICRLYNKIKHGGYDVVHIQGEFYYYIPALLANVPGTRFVYTVHNDAAKENSRWNRLFTPLKRRFFKSGKVKAVTISPASLRSFKEYYGEDVPAAMIPNGVSLPAVANSPRPKGRIHTFVNPGRISPQKNQLPLVRAFRRLVDMGEDVSLVIAGTPEHEDILESLRPYLCDRIRYIGTVDDMPSLMAATDAMILPSLWEGLPMSLLEALATGCVPVCSAVGGMADVIRDGDNGLLIPSTDEESIFKALKRAVSLPADTVERISRSARATFPPYSSDRCVASYLRLMEDGQ